MNSNKFCLISMGSIAAIMIGCAPKQTLEPAQQTVVVHETYAPGENLTALTKVTDSEYRCDYPFGGDNGRNLFFSVHTQGSFSNIYKKESVINASMSQKTSGKNKNMAPSYCSTTDMVAFAGKFEGASAHDIYMINASQGSALVQVTSTPNDDENYPCLSRDGKLIVYEKVSSYGRYGDTEVWVKNLQTNENTMLGMGRTPSFSPDGRTIAYVQYAADASTTCLWLMNVDGGNKVQVTNANNGSVWHPRFSPDGNRIVFQCTKNEKSDADLYVIDKNGNNLTQLTINKSYDGEPYWASDGYIYFSSDRGGRNFHYQIWRFKPDGVIVGPTKGGNDVKLSVSYHQVTKGETITEIAQKYGITVRDIVKWNNLQTMTLTPGMRLKVSAQ